MNKIIKKVRQELKQNADEKIRKSGERFFKEKVKMYGMKTALGIQIGKKYWKEIQGRDKKEVFASCEELWKSGYMEESFIACNWSYYIRGQYAKNDFEVFENGWRMFPTGRHAIHCATTKGAFIDISGIFGGS